jgi:hypothetical protein
MRDSTIRRLCLYFILFFLLMVIFPASTLALNPVNIEQISPLRLVTEPGKPLILSFQVNSQIDGYREFTEEILLPVDWLTINQAGSFLLEKGEEIIRLIGIVIPGNTPAGSYHLVYSITDKYGNSYRKELEIQVLPVTNVVVSPQEAPPYVVAGSPYLISFVLYNYSNTGLQLSYELHKQGERDITILTDGVFLQAGEKKTINMTIETDRGIRTKKVDSLRFIVRGGDKLLAQTHVSVEIYPLVSGNITNLYRYIPVTLATKWDSQVFSTQLAGRVNSGKKKEELDFLFNLNAGKNYLNYHTEGFKLRVGDGYFSLSPLTETGTEGRGISGDVKLHNFNLGGFYLVTPDNKKEWAGYLLYPLNKIWEIKANILKLQDGGIYSLQLKYQPVREMKAVLEYARESGVEDGEALKVALSGVYQGIRYSVDYIYNGQNYGEYQKLRLAVPLMNNLSIWGEYRQLQEESILKTKTIGLKYKQQDNSYISLTYSKQEIDRLRLSFSKKYRDIYLSSYFNWDPGDTTDYGLALLYIPEGSLSYRAGLSNLEERKNLYFSIRYLSGKKNYLELFYNQKWVKDGVKEKELGSSFSWSPGKDNLLSLELTTSKYKLSWSRVFNLPVWRDREVGVIRGTVYDAEDSMERGIEGLIIRIADQVTVTDEDGQFLFYGLPTGEHNLFIDNINKDMVTETENPLPVIVNSKGEESLKIGLVRGVTLRGEIIRFAYKDKIFSGDSAPVAQGGIANIMVVLSLDSETHRVYTDQNGCFRFSNIRPGTWSLRIYAAGGISPDYYLEEEKDLIELKPGEVEEITLKVLPRKKIIRIIDEGDVNYN